MPVVKPVGVETDIVELFLFAHTTTIRLFAVTPGSVVETVVADAIAKFEATSRAAFALTGCETNRLIQNTTAQAIKLLSVATECEAKRTTTPYP